MIKTATCRRMQTKLFAPRRAVAIVGWFAVIGCAASHAGDRQAVLAHKGFGAEIAARMMVLMAAASGEQTLANCMHDRYFGSPLLLRKTLWDVWTHPRDDFARALLEVTKEACSKNPPEVAASEHQTWLRTNNDSILLEPGKPTSDPAADMIAAYVGMRGDHSAVRCTLDEETRSEANRLVSEGIRTEPRVPVTLAAYDAYRTLCGLNPGGPAASEIALPAMPDVPTVARERLQIVQDFAICQSGGEANEDACVEQAYQKRSKDLFNQLLSSDSGN